MKLSNLILLSIASIAFFYIQLWDHKVVAPLYLILLACSLSYGAYVKNINIIHISLFLLLLNALEYIIFNMGVIELVAPNENQLIRGTFVFGVQFLLSIFAVVMLIFRVQLSRAISNSKDIALTHFDGIFHWLFIYTSVIYLLALLENIAWSYFELKSWTLIYDNFEGLIYVAWALCCGALLTMMIVEAKSNRSGEANAL